MHIKSLGRGLVVWPIQEVFGRATREMLCDEMLISTTSLKTPLKSPLEGKAADRLTHCNDGRSSR
eukprot:1444950-Heterocapsa_arctica.AAC.1